MAISKRPWLKVTAAIGVEWKPLTQIRCKDIRRACEKLAHISCDTGYYNAALFIDGIEYPAPTGNRASPWNSGYEENIRLIREELLYLIDIHEALYDNEG